MMLNNKQSFIKQGVVTYTYVAVEVLATRIKILISKKCA